MMQVSTMNQGLNEFLSSVTGIMIRDNQEEPQSGGTAKTINCEKPTINKRKSTTKIQRQDKKSKGIKASTTSKAKSTRKIFPVKLYDMVDKAKEQGYEHIVSWTDDGKRFVLKDIALLEKQILPQYFGHSKMRSLSRQLCYWMFERTSRGGSDGGDIYQHPGFVRGHRALISTINRQKFKGVSIKRNGVCINLKGTASVEHRAQAMSTLKKAELNYVKELVARNLALEEIEHTTACLGAIPFEGRFFHAVLSEEVDNAPIPHPDNEMFEHVQHHQYHNSTCWNEQEGPMSRDSSVGFVSTNDTEAFVEDATNFGGEDFKDDESYEEIINFLEPV